MSNSQKNHTKADFNFEVDNCIVKFSSDFDSGNLYQVIQSPDQTVNIHRLQFIITSALDTYKSQVTSKSFFHFSVKNYPINKMIKIKISNVKLLTQLQKTGKLSRYRPFIKNGNKAQYKKMNSAFVKIQEEGDNINILLQFESTESIFFISFALPYSYQKYLNFIRDLPKQSLEFYIRKQVLCYSLQLRLIHLITISSFDHIEDLQGNGCGESNAIIFPERDLNQKQKNFRKPVIILSARVHPGESPSSYAIEGIIKFLISKDLRAQILRKQFQILIVPMLNPDGVYHGFYRMDTLKNNLNRFYVLCDTRQPSIYSLRTLIHHYSNQKKLMYFFDLHGHPSFKGSFLYGNAFEDIICQTQTQIFAKLLSLNSQTFDLQACNFNKNQMKAKDRFDKLTKQGCARVYTFRTTNIIHSYTLELGFHSCLKLNNLCAEQNTDFVNENYPNYKFLHKEQKIQNLENFNYNKQHYYNEGIALMITILDSLQINPYTRITNSDFGSNYELRKIVVKDLYYNQQRFKIIQKNLNQKMNNVNELIQQIFFKKIRQRRYLNDNFKGWPECVKFKKYFYFHKRLSRTNYKFTIQEKKSTDIIQKNQDNIQNNTMKIEQKTYSQLETEENNTQKNYSPEKFSLVPLNSESSPYIPNYQSSSQKQILQKFKMLETYQENNQEKYEKKQSQSCSPNKLRLKLKTKYRQKKYTYTEKKQLENTSPSIDLMPFDDAKLQVYKHMPFNKTLKSEQIKNQFTRINKSKQSGKQSILINKNKTEDTNFFQYLQSIQKQKKILPNRLRIDSDFDKGYAMINSNRLNKIKLPQLQTIRTNQKFNIYFNQRRKSSKQ